MLNWHICAFQLIMVSFYPYLFISTHGRTLVIFILLLTCLIMPINNVITQTIFVVLFTSGLLLTFGKPLDTLSGLSPRYLSAAYSQLTISSFFCRHCMMTDYAFFSLGSDRWGRTLPCSGGALPSAPIAASPHTIHNPIGVVLPYEPQGLGGETEGPSWYYLPVGTGWGRGHKG